MDPKSVKGKIPTSNHQRRRLLNAAYVRIHDLENILTRLGIETESPCYEYSFKGLRDRLRHKQAQILASEQSD